MTFHSALYRGQLMHARRDAFARRAFRYPVFMASLDLDELDVLDRELRLFSHDRTNVFALHDRDYAAALSPSRTAAPGALRASLAALRAGNALPEPDTTRLVTNLKVFGYVFNPVSFFLGYTGDRLTSVIAEVNNTYGGNLRYVLGPAQRLPDHHGRIGFRHVRELFVSPFLHGPATYDFWFDAPLDAPHLAIAMHVQQRERQVFVARFEARRTELTDRALISAAVRYPLMTAQVIGLIHWQALKLRLAGVPYRRPDVDHRPLASAD